MKWVSVWTSLTFIGFKIRNLAFIIQFLLTSGINYQALVVLDHSLILCFDDVITASRITLFKATSNYSFYGMIYIRPTKLK